MGKQKQLQVLLTSAGFATLAALMVAICNLHEELTMLMTFLSGSGAIVSFIACMICLDIWRLNPADSHTLKTLLSQYWHLLRLRLKAPYLKRLIKQKTMDAKKTSTETLFHIIRNNQNSFYGKRYNFSKMRTRTDFTEGHPLTTYEHYKSYIKRIENGEQNILYPGETVAIVVTSGTTTLKLNPYCRNFLEDFIFMFTEIPAHLLLNLMNLKRHANFFLPSSSTSSKTKAGIPIGPATKFLIKHACHQLVPNHYHKLQTEDAAYHTQAVFMLAEKEMRYISGFSADLMYSYVKFMTVNWESICDDIAKGEIGTWVEMPDDIRTELSRHLKADPTRASELKQAMKKGTIGVLKRAWPEIAFITMGKSAGFKVCANALQENQFKGIKVIDMSHPATEGLTGMNLEGGTAHVDNVFTCTLFSEHFVEFIPVKYSDDEYPSTIFPEQLKVGELYEVVHTNSNGLYRYRTGDVIEVVGFMNNTPKYKFLYRLGQRLNIVFENTSEEILLQAINESRKSFHLTADLVNYTATESIQLENITGKMTKGHYVIFMEFDNNVPIDVMRLAKKIDQDLCALYKDYAHYRAFQSIGPLEVIQVKRGTFEGLKSYIWTRGPHSQYKTPRVLRKAPALKYLINEAIRCS